jgi:hypothetical protein
MKTLNPPDPLTRSLTYVVDMPEGWTTRFARNPLSSLRDRARKGGLAPSGLQSGVWRMSGGIRPLARKLGEALGVEQTIPPLEPVGKQPFRCIRQDLWPPEVWAEMEAIRKGEKL